MDRHLLRHTAGTQDGLGKRDVVPGDDEVSSCPAVRLRDTDFAVGRKESDKKTALLMFTIIEGLKHRHTQADEDRRATRQMRVTHNTPASDVLPEVTLLNIADGEVK